MPPQPCPSSKRVFSPLQHGVLTLLTCASLAISNPAEAQNAGRQTPDRPIAFDNPSDDSERPQRDPPAKLLLGEAQTSLIQNTVLAAPLAGIVESVAVSEGDRVDADTVLVDLADDLAAEELAAARAALQTTRLESQNDVAVRYAERTLEVNAHKLKQSGVANETYRGAVTDLELRQLQLEADQSALAVEQARHDLKVADAQVNEKLAAFAIAEIRLDRHRIRAPTAGLVAEIDVQPGQWVDAGSPVVRVISLDPLRVECFVDANEHGRELLGRGVTFNPTQPIDAESYRGEITFVSPERHPVTGKVRLWATIANPDQTLLPGTPGRLLVE
jgi:macrolide-specific efflux system membrane fusion protein